VNLDLMAGYAPVVLHGLWVTIAICAASTLLGLVAGLAVELTRQHVRSLRVLCRVYVEGLRGAPILILLFLLYYAAPGLGLVLDPETAGVIGLGLYNGAYFAEIFRAGFESIPRGQVEAASSLGLSPLRILTRVKLPQMPALILPSAVNQVIILIKDSAVLSIITVPELTKETSKIINETVAIAEPLLVLALLYWALVEGVSQLGLKAERRLTRYLKRTEEGTRCS